MKLLVIDGNSIANRAFYGIRNMSSPDGFPTNMIYGFISMMESARKITDADGVVVAFDVHAPTFRHKAFEEYKAGRASKPDEFHLQMQKLQEILPNMGIACLGVEGYEADDILGTIARNCTEKGHQCVLYTGDKDSFQLIDDNVVVLFPQNGGTGLIIDKDEIAKKYNGLVPAQLVDLKGLQGDKSDNIPGVPGIGEKTAINLIAQYGDIDKIYNDIDSLDITASVRKKLEAGRESAFMSREIGTICKEVPGVSKISVQDFVGCEANVEALRKDFQLLGLQKFLSALEAGLAYTDSHAK